MRPPFSLTLFSGCGVWRHLAPFAMHFVVFNIFNFDRQKGARPNMQRHLVKAHALPLQCLDQRGREVQTGVGAATAPSSRANKV